MQRKANEMERQRNGMEGKADARFAADLSLTRMEATRPINGGASELSNALV